MTASSRSLQAIIGFRIKSGWAAAVAICGPTSSPAVIGRYAVKLSDPDAPESKQPYHARMGKLEEDGAEIARRIKIIRRVAKKSVAELVKSLRVDGYGVRKACMVVGSLRDPSTIANQHIRAHALEGRIFRTVLASALRSRRIPVRIFIERALLSTATRALGRPGETLKRSLAQMRPAPKGPWRGEDKTAALAAWIMLRRG